MVHWANKDTEAFCVPGDCLPPSSVVTASPIIACYASSKQRLPVEFICVEDEEPQESSQACSSPSLSIAARSVWAVRGAL